MTFYAPGSIEDDDIREVYVNDILHQSRIVQARFGILPFLTQGNWAEPTGFYNFRMYSYDTDTGKEIPEGENEQPTPR